MSKAKRPVAWAGAATFLGFDGAHVLVRLERLLALVAVIVVAVFVCIYIYHMATTSLWHDELYSVQQFSSRGIWHAVSDYHVPNNHIFFNALNALTPTPDPYEPLAARLWSFVAVLGCLTVATGWLVLRGLHLEAVVFAIMVFANEKNLDLMTQARGYGFAVCFAVLGAILTHRYLESGSTRSISGVAATTVLGTWTVPTFLGFAGPLMLCAFLFRPRWNALIAGGLAIVCIAIVHLPLVQQMVQQLGGFGDTWGRAFASWTGIGEGASDYLFPGIDPAWALAALASVLSVGLLVPGSNADAMNATRRTLALTVAVFFAGCLVLESPLVRSTQFMVGPVALLAALLLPQVFAQFPGPVRLVGRGALLAGLLVLVGGVVTSFSFTAKQSWRETAHFVDAVFPRTSRSPSPPARNGWMSTSIHRAGPRVASMPGCSRRAVRSWSRTGTCPSRSNAVSEPATMREPSSKFRFGNGTTATSSSRSRVRARPIWSPQTGKASRARARN